MRKENQSLKHNFIQATRVIIAWIFLLQSYASKYNKSVEEAFKAGIFYLHPDGSMYSLQRGCVASLRICRPFPQQDSQSCVILFCW